MQRHRVARNNGNSAMDLGQGRIFPAFCFVGRGVYSKKHPHDTMPHQREWPRVALVSCLQSQVGETLHMRSTLRIFRSGTRALFPCRYVSMQGRRRLRKRGNDIVLSTVQAVDHKTCTSSGAEESQRDLVRRLQLFEVWSSTRSVS